MKPVKEKWWDTCVKSYLIPRYRTEANAKKAKETISGGKVKTRSAGATGFFIWGDRLKVISGNFKTDLVVKVAGRGVEAWVKSKHLGGESLLEVYIIDVGQGDGLLVVTPEGHNIMVDGGDARYRQNGGKNAADFIDWKFFKDYTRKKDRGNDDLSCVKLDAMIASHNDADHFGGLLDLLNYKDPKNDAELQAPKVLVESFYHAGLSWWTKFKIDKEGKRVKDRTLSKPSKGFYTKLLDDRASAEKATENISSPDTDTLSGSWGGCIAAAVNSKKASNPSLPTNIERLTTESHQWLPGFDDKRKSSKVAMRVLGPVAEKVGSKIGLKKFPDGDSKNTNGHSVVLRLDYKKRRILLTGDLNTHSQRYIMKKYGADFSNEFGCDVAKGCHHGSQDISYKFLQGLAPVATVISSGDAESHDHPRPTIVSSSAITGRKLLDNAKENLIMPLVYMTEIARSYKLGKVAVLNEYQNKRPKFERSKPIDSIAEHNTITEKSKFRVFHTAKPHSPTQWPRLDDVKTVTGLVYGLVNVRTDGKTLFFATLEEKGNEWAITTLSDSQIQKADVVLS